jgi:L-2-hydroxyglutarate oxidase
MKKRILIAGGGIVGLATAYQLLSRLPDSQVCILEKESDVGRHQTSHNSGVIHSGIYYKPGSLKAMNCVKGYRLLIEFCQENDIRFELCGKLIVATRQAELPILHQLLERGHLNGLSGLRLLKANELKDYEPHVAGLAGIYVPQTGIVDYHHVALKLAEKIQQRGGQIFLMEKVEKISVENHEVKLRTSRNEFTGDLFINCAGLYSDFLAAQSIPRLDIRIIPFRGEYYKLKKEKEYLVKNLIYPVPDPAFPFLGVHFTRMIQGGVEAGPNAVLALKREGYRKTDFQWDEFLKTLTWPGFHKVTFRYWQTGLGEVYRSLSKRAFTRALQRLIPEITPDDLEEGGSGVRAQACHRNGSLVDDFVILEKKGIIHVCNAPSPAATSSLAIGEEVARRAMQQFQ